MRPTRPLTSELQTRGFQGALCCYAGRTLFPLVPQGLCKDPKILATEQETFSESTRYIWSHMYISRSNVPCREVLAKSCSLTFKMLCQQFSAFTEKSGPEKQHSRRLVLLSKLIYDKQNIYIYCIYLNNVCIVMNQCFTKNTVKCSVSLQH
jgi:hypothetical protein